MSNLGKISKIRLEMSENSRNFYQNSIFFANRLAFVAAKVFKKAWEPDFAFRSAPYCLLLFIRVGLFL